jgi:hypothetical protein
MSTRMLDNVDTQGMFKNLCFTCCKETGGEVEKDEKVEKKINFIFLLCGANQSDIILSLVKCNKCFDELLDKGKIFTHIDDKNEKVLNEIFKKKEQEGLEQNLKNLMPNNVTMKYWIFD